MPYIDYILRHSPISTSIILKIELFMKPLHSNHFPVISEFSDTMIWCKNFSKQNTTGIFLSSMNSLKSGYKHFLLCFLGFLLFEFSYWKTHDEKDFLHLRFFHVSLLCELSFLTLSYTKHIYSCSWKNYPLYKTNDFLHPPHVGFIAHVSPLKLYKKSWEEFPSIPPNNTIILY